MRKFSLRIFVLFISALVLLMTVERTWATGTLYFRRSLVVVRLELDEMMEQGFIQRSNWAEQNIAEFLEQNTQILLLLKKAAEYQGSLQLFLDIQMLKKNLSQVKALSKEENETFFHLEFFVWQYYEQAQQIIQKEVLHLGYLLKDGSDSANRSQIFTLKQTWAFLKRIRDIRQELESFLEMRQLYSKRNHVNFSIALDHVKHFKKLISTVEKKVETILLPYSHFHSNLVFGSRKWVQLYSRRPVYEPPVSWYSSITSHFPFKKEQVFGFIFAGLLLSEKVQQVNALSHQASHLRSHPESLYRQLSSRISPEALEEIHRDASHLGTVLSDKYPVLVRTPEIVGRLFSKDLTAQAHIQNVIRYFGDTPPGQSEILKIMSAYEMSRLSE